MAHYDDLFDMFMMKTNTIDRKTEAKIMEKKMQDIVAAWLKGETIQYFHNNKWVDWTYGEYTELSPMTKPLVGWRVKPKNPWETGMKQASEVPEEAYVQGWKDAEEYYGVSK